MTAEEIVKELYLDLRAVGLPTDVISPESNTYQMAIARITDAVAEEREACAQVASERARKWTGDKRVGAERIEQVIRARGAP